MGSLLEYQRDIDALSGSFLFRADFQYTSKVYFSPKQLDILSQDDVALLNLRMGIEFENGWSVAVFGKNITNTKYLGHVIDSLDFDLAFAEIGSPRQYGLSLGYRF